MSLMLNEDRCANPNCHNSLNRNRVSQDIIYCVVCQSQIIILKETFPLASMEMVLKLMFEGKLSRPKASMLLDIPLNTIRRYCLSGFLDERREGKAFVIDLDDLVAFQKNRSGLISLKETAALAGISKDRLDYLDKRGYFRARKNLSGHKVYRRSDVERIQRIDRHVKSLENHKRSKAHQLRPTRHLLTVKDVAKRLRYYCLNNIRQRIRSGQLKARKTSKGYLITRPQLIAFCKLIVSKKIYVGKSRIIRAAQRYLNA